MEEKGATGINMLEQPTQENTAEVTQTDARPVGSTSVSVPNEAFQINVIPATRFMGAGKTNVYRCSTEKPRGLALILNYRNFENKKNLTRQGSEVDVDRMQKLFQQLGYKVDVHTDLSWSKTFETVRAFRDNGAHEQADSTIVVIMSHGNSQGRKDEFTTSNNCIIDSGDIIELFNSYDCEKLAGKPKIFLFQFCRGDKVDVRAKKDSARSLEYPNRPRKIDSIVVVYATTPGYVAYRDNSSGSWFGYALCHVFMNHACEYHLQKLLSEVDRYVEYRRTEHAERQTLDISYRGFNKNFYFNPGLSSAI